jgi:RNA polymerase sigma-70 factor (ECF subfamily)
LRIVRRHALAADVVEQAYLQIWQSAGEFNPGQSGPLAWMVAIARRLAIDEARRAPGDGEPEVEEESEGPAAVPRHQLTEELKRLLTCIGRLEPERQRMLLLAYYGAFEREQLAIKLDMPVNLLRASLRRSLVEVEQCLKA